MKHFYDMNTWMYAFKHVTRLSHLHIFRKLYHCAYAKINYEVQIIIFDIEAGFFTPKLVKLCIFYLFKDINILILCVSHTMNYLVALYYLAIIIRIIITLSQNN